LNFDPTYRQYFRILLKLSQLLVVEVIVFVLC